VRSWRYAESGKRDLRLDLLRGYCVFAMTVDHLDAPTWLYVLTGGNRFFVSAAEGFLFISGLVMGIVYRPIVERSGLPAAAAKALKRSLLLYVVTVGATLGFMWLSSRLGLPWSVGVDVLDAVPRVLALRRTFYLTDVLLLYTCLIAVAPVAFYLLRRGHTWLLLGAAWGVWAAHQIRTIDMPWPSEEGAFYYIAAWQVLFVSGLAMGWHRRALARHFGAIVAWTPLAGSALCLLIFLAIWRWGSLWLGRYYPDGGGTLTEAFAKWNLPPARILAVACVFTFFFLVAHFFWVPIRATLGRFLLPLGQSALTAYVLQLVVVAGLTAYRDHVVQLETTSKLRGTVFQLLAVVLLWLVTVVWASGRGLIARLTSERTLETRLDPILGAGLAAALGLAILVGPQPAVPVAGFVPVRDDRNSLDEPHYLVHVPPDAAQRQPLPVMVLLHDRNEDAELFGDELIALADRDGWLLVAPQLPYEEEHLDADVIAAEAPALLRGVRDVIAELSANTGLILRRRVVLFGYGRGASLAERYAQVYPGQVRGAALLGGGAYTLPPRADGSLDPPFPFGVGGLASRVGRPVEPAQLQRVNFWIGVGSNDTDPDDTARAWDPYLGVTRVERSRNLALALRQLGAPVHFEVFSGAAHRLTPEMRLAVGDFAQRLRAQPPQDPPRLPRGVR
jgi:pimeloyl-ACP methyl ester carboxylesterase